MKPFKLHPSAIDPIRTGPRSRCADRSMEFELVDAGCFRLGTAIHRLAFWMHFLKPPYIVQPFNLATAVILLIVTLSLGFVIGSIFAVLWNWIHKR